jgi:hypothetical protein
MSNLAIAIAAIPGAPIGVLVMNLAPALGPVGLALLVLAVLGGPPCGGSMRDRPRHPELKGPRGPTERA